MLEEYLAQGMEAGMDEIIAKPLYIQILTALLVKYNIKQFIGQQPSSFASI